MKLRLTSLGVTRIPSMAWEPERFAVGFKIDERWNASQQTVVLGPMLEVFQYSNVVKAVKNWCAKNNIVFADNGRSSAYFYSVDDAVLCHMTFAGGIDI